MFFKTDEPGVDSADGRELKTLIPLYSDILRDRRIELLMVGHADRRGGSAHNMRLAKRRAESAKAFFDSHLGSYPLYSSWEAVSRGELDAAQGRPSSGRMALDRVVNVFSSYSIPMVVRMEPIVIRGEVPSVRRIVGQTWSRFGCSNIARQPTSAGGAARSGQKKAIEGLLRGLMEDKRAMVWGSEDKKGRRIREEAA